MLLALLTQLAVSVSFDQLSDELFSKISMAIYGYVLLLEGLLILTPWLISGVEPLGGYTYTRIPGPLYWIYELFVIASMLAITLLPAWGLKHGRDVVARNRCKLWLVLSTPLAILVLAIIGLLHFGFRWFNATVTAPLLVAALLAAVGYAVHHQRPIDLNFYLPGSRLRKSKTRLFAKLNAFGQAAPRLRTISRLLEQLATILECPVALVSRHGTLHDTSANSKLSSLPISALHTIRRMAVANELRKSKSGFYALMARHDVATIVRFSLTAAPRAIGCCWVIHLVVLYTCLRISSRSSVCSERSPGCF